MLKYSVLSIKNLAGVTPEINLEECIACIPLPGPNKAACSGFET